MCGFICCFGNEECTDALRQEVLVRARRIIHRGSDWTGVYCKGNNIMVHQRQAMVGTSSGAQPLYNEKRDQATSVNGEIYNYPQLKEMLEKKGYRFETKSDCEVIPHLYEEFGADCVRYLKGMFTFALVDERTGTWTVARDHRGICPLYVKRDIKGRWWIASELKAIVDICGPLEEFLPGHVYTSTSAKVPERLQQWYRPAWYDSSKFADEGLYLNEIKTRLEKSVVSHLTLLDPQVKPAVLLSGGLDSTLVASIAKRYFNSLQDPPPLHSFAIGLVGSPDLKAAKEASIAIGTIHHELIYTVQEGLDARSDVVYHLETYDPTTIRAGTPMQLLARYMRTLGFRMALSGEGADEMFGGYLYLHMCPSPEEMQKELVTKVRKLHKFDCLRANKAMSAWGVEPRVPFLDIDFLDYVMSIHPKYKMCGKSTANLYEEHKGELGWSPRGRIEKYILRKAFEGYLPPSLLWRQKEQFSDGVGYAWIDGIRAHDEKAVTDREMLYAGLRFPHNTPTTKEAYAVRAMFEHHFPGDAAARMVPGGPSVACSTPAAIAWDASFKQFSDQSGRAVTGIHDSAYDERVRGKKEAEPSTSSVLAPTKKEDIEVKSNSLVLPPSAAARAMPASSPSPATHKFEPCPSSLLELIRMKGDDD